MIKQDYLLRMIQEIISMLVEVLLYRKKLRKEEWTSYDSQLNTLLGMPTNELMALNADDLITRYAEMQDGMNKLELSAVTMLKLSDEMGDEHLLQKSRLRQEGLMLLKYIQQVLHFDYNTIDIQLNTKSDNGKCSQNETRIALSFSMENGSVQLP